MATAEGVTLGLKASLQVDESVWVKTEHASVVECAADRFNSRIGKSYTLPTNSSASAGFVYDGVLAGRDVRAGLSRRSAAVAALPMEDICFYVKEIDNSRLRRKVDPADKRMMGRLIVLGIIVVVFCLTSFGPVAAKRQSGYRLQSLNNQYQKLRMVNSQLKDHQAKLSNVQRVQKLAKARGLAAAPPERYAWQDHAITPSSGGSELARNHPAPHP